MARLLLVSLLATLAIGLAAPAQAGAAPNLDRLYIGDDGSLVSFSHDRLDRLRLRREPGQSVSRTWSACRRGTLTAIADRGRSVAESDEDNNARSVVSDC